MSVVVPIGCVGITWILPGGTYSNFNLHTPDVHPIRGITPIFCHIFEIQGFDMINHGIPCPVAGPPQRLDTVCRINVIHDVFIWI